MSPQTRLVLAPLGICGAALGKEARSFSGLLVGAASAPSALEATSALAPETQVTSGSSPARSAPWWQAVGLRLPLVPWAPGCCSLTGKGIL